MIEVYLDSERLEMPEDTSIGLNVGIASIEDPTAASASYSQTIDVPMTTVNMAIFNHSEQILSPEIFNHSEHTAAVYQDGVELIKGKAFLDGVTDSSYKMQIVGNEFDWLEAIRDKKLNEIDGTVISALKEYVALDSVQREAVFFALAEHGKWWQNIDDETVRRRWATYADLIPFVQISTILSAIFKGYSIDYGTLAYQLSQMYVTGRWKTPDNADVLAEDNAFKLSCSGNNLVEVTVNGENYTVVGGKITASNGDTNPIQVDVFDTIDDDPNARIVMEGGSATIEGEEIQHYIPNFEPSEALTTAYKVHLKYTSSMSYISPQLGYAFADTIHLGGERVAKLSLEDGLQAIDDGAEALNDGVFNSAKVTEAPATTSPTDAEMTDFYIELSEPAMYTEVVQVCWAKYINEGAVATSYTTLATVSGSTIHFRAACNFDYAMATNRNITPRAAIGLKTKYGDIVVIEGNGLAYQKLDFSIYGIQRTLCTNHGEIKRCNVRLFEFSDIASITFDVNLQTMGYDVPAIGTGLQVGFSYALAGIMGASELLVSVEEAEIEPVFNFAPKHNDPISLNDVGGDALATDVLKGIMQMFNLRIYANSDTKIVHILPYSEFYTDTVVDWSDRIDSDKGVEITTIGDSIGNSFKLLYAEDNQAIVEYNKHHREPYLSWATPLLNKQKIAEYTLDNGVFNAPMNVSAQTVFPTTTNAGKLLQLASDDEQGTLDELEVSQLPYTVVLKQPATGEEGVTEYNVGCTGLLVDYLQPNFTLVNSSYGWCLSFSDKEGVEGLHKHYDRQVEVWNYGKRITCYCRLYPQEIESLRKAGTSPVDFRSMFKLKINGEDIYCRLESIENYEPQNATHKCTFIFFN